MEGFNRAFDYLEGHLAEPVDAAALARIARTSEHHFRRMFATLSGMGLAEYVRRRRMTLAATEVTNGESTVLEIAQRWGYASGDAFARAFRSVHGIGPEQAREPRATFQAQPRIAFALTTTGRDPMAYRLETTPKIRLVGHSTRLPLVHRGPNEHIAAFIGSIPVEETIVLKQHNDCEPRGVLAVCTDFDEDRADGSQFTYLHGVATSGDVPDGLDAIELTPSTWAVFRPRDDTDEALQELWPRVFTEWFPSSGYQLASGPEIVTMQRTADGTGLLREFWIPIEPVG